MRNIMLFSSLGKSHQVIESDAPMWGELKRELSRRNISLSNMKAVIGENQLTVESDEAMLPDGDFTLFLMNVKTKSGAAVKIDRKQLLENIKALIAKKPELKDNFKSGKLNMTQMPSDVLQELYNKFSGGSSTIPTPTATQQKKEEPKKEEVKKPVPPRPEKKEVSASNGVGEVVNSVKESKENPYSRVHAIINELVNEANTLNDKTFISQVKDIKNYANSYFSIDGQSKKQEMDAKAKLDAELLEKARKMSRNFGDVKSF